ncbi:Uncharacterized protein dnm_071540 [Desulfonema magnum]|uniref:Uncharacterized protein n=1 Tax=Desulfonema magnum TaxID=45655 RepID=A0A975BTQ9_9BACT|nr:Uncharacterized protein dnm_071540 [Desulfonema magnum]
MFSYFFLSIKGSFSITNRYIVRCRGLSKKNGLSCLACDELLIRLESLTVFREAFLTFCKFFNL